MAGRAGRQRALLPRRVGARLDHVGRGERRRGGRGRTLATISSAGENAFVFALSLMVTGAWALDSVGGDQGPWLGGRKIESKWTWVTREPWAYTDWAGGEPSGTYNGAIEDRLQMRGQDGTLRPRETWNDQGNGGFEGLPHSYVIEFER